MFRKGQRVFEPYSIGLEDQIGVNYKLVGTKSWFATAFEPGAVSEEEKIIVSTKKDLLPIKEQLKSYHILGVDTETTGPENEDKSYSMNPVNPDTRIVTLQIGTEDCVWIVQPQLIPYLQDILEDENQLHLGHNWIYDYKFLLTKYAVHPMNMYCSMLVEQILSAGLPGRKIGLADCVRSYPDYLLISKATRTEFVNLNNGLLSRKMLHYAARDVVLLFPVYRGQQTQIKKYNLSYIAQLEFDVIPCTAEMELEGVFLDVNRLNLFIRYWTKRQADTEEKILQMYSKKRKALGGSNFLIPELNEVFDLASNKDKIEALRKIGVTLDDVKRVTLLSVNDPIANLMGEYSGITKMTSTYGSNLLRRINSTTSRWHPRFAQCGAGLSDSSDGDNNATGRFVSDAQQFPRKSDRYSIEEDINICAQVQDMFADVIKQYSKK